MNRSRCRGEREVLRQGRHCRTRATREGTGAEQRREELSGIAFYRKYTVALLRRYLRVAMQVGRVPSCMRNDVFCGRATSYRVHSFEDGVIFVQDVEMCLRKLDSTSLQLIERVVLQDFSQGEAAEMLGYSLRHAGRLLHGALDQLTDILLEHRLLELEHRLSRGR